MKGQKMQLTVAEIKAGISAGNLFLCDNKLYTKEEWQKIQEAEHQVEHFDLLQLTKKIQL